MSDDSTDTHVERINPGDNAAANPWAAGAYPAQEVPSERGEQRLYQMLAKGTHNGVLLQPGATVMLYADEVGPQHRLVTEEAPLVPPVAFDPATVMDPRNAEIERFKIATAAKEDALGSLTQEHADMKATLAATDTKLADMDSLRDEVAAKSGENRELTEANGDLRSERDAARNELAAKDAEIARLTDENSKLHAELDAATAPPEPPPDSAGDPPPSDVS